MGEEVAVLSIRYGDNARTAFGQCKSDEWIEVNTKFTPSQDYIEICSGYNVNDYFYIKDVQLEEGTQVTPYEPFKSNILSTSEDVALRGVGDVKDTLDCLTGEITERIGEVVLNGSEDGWTMSNTMIEEGFVRFYGNPIDGMKTNSYLICDKLPQSIKSYGNGDAFECVAGRNNNARINVKLKLETLGLVDNTISNNSMKEVDSQEQKHYFSNK